MPDRNRDRAEPESTSRTDPQAIERIERCLRRDVPTVHQDHSVAEAADLLASSPHELLPVLDDEGKVCGVFTERGVLRALFPPYLQEMRSTDFLRGSHLVGSARRVMEDPVRDHISKRRPILTWPPSEFQLAEDFLHGVGSVIIVDDDRQVVGIIGRATFCRVIFEAAVREAADGKPLAEPGDRDADG